MIDYAEFRRLLTSTTKYTDVITYIAEVGGAAPLEVNENKKMLAAIWTMGRDGLTIRSLSAACEISARQIALQYGLPTRTVENWSTGIRTPPEWQLPLIAYAVLSDYMAYTANNANA